MSIFDDTGQLPSITEGPRQLQLFTDRYHLIRVFTRALHEDDALGKILFLRGGGGMASRSLFGSCTGTPVSNSSTGTGSPVNRMLSSSADCSRTILHSIPHSIRFPSRTSTSTRRHVSSNSLRWTTLRSSCYGVNLVPSVPRVLPVFAFLSTTSPRCGTCIRPAG
jgi:hypothetical protein